MTIPPFPVTRRGLLKAGAAVAAATTLAPPQTASAAATTLAPARAASAAEGRFELTAPSTSLIWRKALYDETVMQSFAIDSAHGHLYTVQLKNGAGSDAAGHLCLTKLDLSGTILGHMYLMGFGHGVQIGVEPSGSAAYLWTETDGVPNSEGSSRGTRLCRFRFADGQTLTTSSAALTTYAPIAGATNTTCTIDPSTDRLVMRYRAGGSFRLAAFTLASVKAGAPQQVYDIAQPGGLGTFQGYAAYGDFVYLLTGDSYDISPPPGNTYLTCLDLRTGEQVQRARSVAGKSLDFREPEGMGIQLVSGAPRLCLGLASEPGPRLASIFYKSAFV
ncbi:phage baseplate protein [Nonomuraea gerenzanensis]|uniref:Putative major teichoic acid biosynthesis protein C n=1 Tax=Nonomuraea gerenzanensis TaxID=93944 RepID=A0A1M4E6C4_9ACTN|nr:teichoic acid biosynthesis protein C [Nonomuraea gerenzanensis]UBU16578.1 teichoic acid biosynthesis protein C [Nonomuraea gerenzanensis]SBO94405.1 Putative major teichoic acid biosynthesis protein C [Nonomuraea gerenzanensis]